MGSCWNATHIRCLIVNVLAFPLNWFSPKICVWVHTIGYNYFWGSIFIFTYLHYMHSNIVITYYRSMERKSDIYVEKMPQGWIGSFFRKYFIPLCHRDQLILWQEVAPVKTFSKLAFYVETRLPRNDSQIQHVPSILFWASFSNHSCKLLNFSLTIFS